MADLSKTFLVFEKLILVVRWKLVLPNGKLNKRLKTRTAIKAKCLMLW